MERETLVPSQSAIGEIKMAGSSRKKASLARPGHPVLVLTLGTGERCFPVKVQLVKLKMASTVRFAESPGSVRTQPRKSVRFPSQSVIGEINLGLLSFTVQLELQLCWHETAGEQNHDLRARKCSRHFELALPTRNRINVSVCRITAKSAHSQMQK